MKTGRKPLSVVQVNCAFDNGLTDPDARLARYFTLTGWRDALVRAGAGPVAVVQRSRRDARAERTRLAQHFERGLVVTASATVHWKFMVTS